MAKFDAASKDVDILKHFVGQAAGKTFLINGPSQRGIGGQLAITLAGANPKQIILAGRNEAKITPVVEQINKINPSITVKFVHIDLLNNTSVRKAAHQIHTITEKVDVLINNAGVMAVRNFVQSEDGVESQFAACYLGHFLLTNLLLKKGLMGSEGDTIVNVGSLGYQLAEANLDDINFQDGKIYNGWKAYGQAKTALTLFNGHLARKMASRGTFVVIAHPGGNPLPPQTTVSLSQAAGVILFAALNPDLREMPGVFIVENGVYTETKDYATNEETAEKLWKLSERLVEEVFSY